MTANRAFFFRKLIKMLESLIFEGLADCQQNRCWSKFRQHSWNPLSLECVVIKPEQCTVKL
jgi:hypothetical protein